ncbi:hypothetical protein CPC08DRAFT_710808 [Agrocybe pediades]|nr:hypothetical protein CPC08DRAFT_710808 [Agrocybe pediades]
MGQQETHGVANLYPGTGPSVATRGVASNADGMSTSSRSKKGKKMFCRKARRHSIKKIHLPAIGQQLHSALSK